jgi:DNA-binding MarR family transcriptional regulator
MTKSIDELNEILDLSNIATYQAGVAQSTVHRLLQKHTNDCLRPYSISTMQWFIIGTIYDAGPNGIRLTDLAKKVDTTLSFLTTAINQLEARGILERTSSESDSRAKLVTVTDEFERIIPTIEEDLRNKLRKSFYAKVSPEDLRVYLRVIYQFSSLK